MENPTSASGGMKGKVVMVTGANAGMGKEISLALARMGATLVMVSRDQQRGDAARKDVVSATGNQQVELLLADLSSQKSIRNLARDFKARHDRLDVLVNNAGMSLPARSVTADGIETVFATNHLGPFLLTNLLLPVLTAAAPSRVVIVSSGVQAMAKIDFEDLQSAKSYSEIRSYNQSKLANLANAPRPHDRLAAYRPCAILSTRERCSGSNHGGSPASAFSSAWLSTWVAVRTQLTRGSLAIHFSTACGHVRTPRVRSSSGFGLACMIPPWSGLNTSTPIPSSSASGSTDLAACCASGL